MAIIIPTPCDQPETFYEEQLLELDKAINNPMYVGEKSADAVHVAKVLGRLITILRMNERDRLNHIKGAYY